MKEKAKSIRLQRRIKEWEARGGHNHASKHVHRCPGSRKK